LFLEREGMLLLGSKSALNPKAQSFDQTDTKSPVFAIKGIGLTEW
jgi:hypothetical protein